ncbi:3'-5' exoribonuclease 1 [Anaeramoeba ignava]|uniref:3'-5' exoribonuclease 1 n=1 Tax=Anaeramoeba ignava TaxID=1746090 RepID=A0A9Q0L9R3_ANAIG|nr:3'-5' exoribonuclease 1 [Anaeramoeba ignava]
MNSIIEKILILDFEATCGYEIYEPEIIEFPVVILNTQNLMIEGFFHSYVQPISNQKISKFCTSLTGITQQQVDFAPKFPKVLELFEKWLIENEFLDKDKNVIGNWVFLTCSDNDFETLLESQLKVEKNIKRPSYFNKWIDLQKIYSDFYGFNNPKSLKNMIKEMEIEMEGNFHSGFDDAKNTARVIVKLILDGVSFGFENCTFWKTKEEEEKNEKIEEFDFFSDPNLTIYQKQQKYKEFLKKKGKKTRRRIRVVEGNVAYYVQQDGSSEEDEDLKFISRKKRF